VKKEASDAQKGLQGSAASFCGLAAPVPDCAREPARHSVLRGKKISPESQKRTDLECRMHADGTQMERRRNSKVV
jgi:hypothetical protein